MMNPFNKSNDDMENSKFMLVGILVALIVLSAVLRWQHGGFGKGEVVIDQRIHVRVEVAASDATRERGLSGRESLAEDRGVLFLFPVSAQYTFWMKDMRFPIDAIWIDGGVIVDISFDVQPPLPGEEIPVFFPTVPADTILEVPAGFVREHGLKLGMPVDIRVDRRGTLR